MVAINVRNKQINKLKPAIKKSGSLAIYVLGKTCNEQILLNGVSTMKNITENNDNFDQLIESLEKSINKSLLNRETKLKSSIR